MQAASHRRHRGPKAQKPPGLLVPAAKSFGGYVPYSFSSPSSARRRRMFLQASVIWSSTDASSW